MSELGELLKKVKTSSSPTPVVGGQDKSELSMLIQQADREKQTTAQSTGEIIPANVEKLKTVAYEGTGVPSIQRISQGFTLSPLGVSFDPSKYMASTGSTNIWDMVGDLVTTATSILPGSKLGGTAIKSAVASGAGAATGAALQALGGQEKIAEAVKKYPALQPIMIAIQAASGAKAMETPKKIALSEEGQATKDMGIKATQSAEAIQQRIEPNVTTKELEIKTKYPDIWEEYVNQPRQQGMKDALRAIGGEATEMTGESTGAAIKSNIESGRKQLGEEFSKVEDAVKEMENGIMSEIPEPKTPINVSYRVSEYLKSQGVGDVLIGQEKIKDVTTMNLIKKRAKLLENAKTTEDLINQKRQFGNEIKAAFEQNKVTDANAKKQVYRIIDDAIYESIPDKKLADDWRSVNKKWSELKSNLEKVGDIESIEPNKIFANKILSKGPEGIDALKSLAGADAVKDAGMQHLFYEATKNEAGRVNVDLIATKLKDLKNKGMAEKIFGDDLKKLDEFVKVGKYAESPLSPRPGINKYGGSQTAVLGEIVKATEMQGWQKALKLVTDIWNRQSAKSFVKAGSEIQKKSLINAVSVPSTGALRGLNADDRKKILDKRGKK